MVRVGGGDKLREKGGKGKGWWAWEERLEGGEKEGGLKREGGVEGEEGGRGGKWGTGRGGGKANNQKKGGGGGGGAPKKKKTGGEIENDGFVWSLAFFLRAFGEKGCQIS